MPLFRRPLGDIVQSTIDWFNYISRHTSYLQDVAEVGVVDPSTRMNPTAIRQISENYGINVTDEQRLYSRFVNRLGADTSKLSQKWGEFVESAGGAKLAAQEAVEDILSRFDSKHGVIGKNYTEFMGMASLNHNGWQHPRANAYTEICQVDTELAAMMQLLDNAKSAGKITEDHTAYPLVLEWRKEIKSLRETMASQMPGYALREGNEQEATLTQKVAQTTNIAAMPDYQKPLPVGVAPASSPLKQVRSQAVESLPKLDCAAFVNAFAAFDPNGMNALFEKFVQGQTSMTKQNEIIAVFTKLQRGFELKQEEVAGYIEKLEAGHNTSKREDTQFVNFTGLFTEAHDELLNIAIKLDREAGGSTKKNALKAELRKDSPELDSLCAVCDTGAALLAQIKGRGRK